MGSFSAVTEAVVPLQALGGSSTITEGCPAAEAKQLSDKHISKSSHKHKGNNSCEVMVISKQFTTSMFLHSKMVAEIACVCVFLFTPLLSEEGKKQKQ